MKKLVHVLTLPLLLAVFLANIYFLESCKKNVGPLTNDVKYDLSGFVLDGSSVAVAGVEIFVDGKSVATTDASGKYTILKVAPGTYSVEAVKDGYTKGKSSITVAEGGAALVAITLKKLAPAVPVGTAGATVTGTNDAGGQVAQITIPPGAVTSTVQISVTNLVGTEATPVPVALTVGKVPGATVNLGASTPNITFPNGIILTFNLPFTHKPGITLNVLSFNETTKAWETTLATVNAGGKTASATIYHFSEWTCLVNATYTQAIDASSTPAIVPYTEVINWQSVLDYRNGIPTDAANSQVFMDFAISSAETKSKLTFASYKNATTVVPLSATAKNSLTFSPASTSNPEGYGTEAYRAWELIKYNYSFKGTLTYKVWDIALNKEVNATLLCWYEIPSYVWLWRQNDTYAIPAISYTDFTKVISKVLGVPKHQGGIGG
jgi:hypothetical protein